MVEGAAPGAVNIATADGHSRDGTLEVLRRFKADEDPDDKLTIVTAEDDGHPDGFWPGEKDEQSRAYASRATGDYLWQVDIDEFYLARDMESILAMLAADPSIDAMTFRQVTFWGGLDYVRRRLVSPARRRRLPPPVQMAPRLCVRSPPPADRAR